MTKENNTQSTREQLSFSDRLFPARKNEKECSHMFYIASGWFNEEQANDLEYIKGVLDRFGIKYFSPKDEFNCPPNSSEQQRRMCFSMNINAIDSTEHVIVNTRDKDMGTLFEAGYAYAKRKDIIYVAFDLKGSFNLMLAQSGSVVCTTRDEFVSVIHKRFDGIITRTQYAGEIE